MKEEAPKKRKPLLFWLVVSLTLGLAPFTPEPHIVGKINWILGGANGMQVTDWFDFAMHGFPWAMLLYTIVSSLIKKKAKV